jgi:hypothetical protein
MHKTYLKTSKSLSLVGGAASVTLPNGSFLHAVYASGNTNSLVTLDDKFIFFGSAQPIQFTVPVPVSLIKSSSNVTIIYT